MEWGRLLLGVAAGVAMLACSSTESQDAADAAPDVHARDAEAPPGDDDGGAPLRDAGRDTGVDASGGPGPPTGVCNADGWCWASPLPQGNPLHAAWQSSDGQVWAVGEVGTVLHWTGTEWKGELLGTTETLLGVWGSTTSDIWAVGTNGTLAHWNGAAWTLSTSGTNELRAVGGSGAGDVYVVGQYGTMLHYNGASWSPVTLPIGPTVDVNGIWVASAAEAWAVGSGSTILHYASGSWTTVTSPTDARLVAVWGADAGNVWAAGWGSTADPTHATVLRYDSVNGWTTQTTGVKGQLYAVSGSSATDVWVVGDEGQTAHYDGMTWSLPAPVMNGALFGVVSSGASGALSVGDAGALLRWSGTKWTNTTTGPTYLGTAILPLSDDDIWMVGLVPGPGQCTAHHWDGKAWSDVPLPVYASNNIFGSKWDDLWAVGLGGSAVHYDGVTWTEMDTQLMYGAPPLFGTSTSDLWTGSYGQLTHWNGSAWSTPISFPTGFFQDGWSLAPNDAWVVGDGAAVLHYDGSSWTTPSGAPGGNEGYSGVWASATDDVWIAGAASLVRWRGAVTGFTTILQPAGTYARGIWGTGASDVWTVGTGIAHWDGATWTASSPISAGLLWRVRGIGTTEVWATGVNGAILRHR